MIMRYKKTTGVDNEINILWILWIRKPQCGEKAKIDKKK